jgi:putative CocE/NonD family hydrolase
VEDRGPFDLRRSDVALRRDVHDLCSAPLDAPLRVMGDVRAIVWWSTDAPDGDLYLQLADEHVDGRVVFLTDGILRARFRAGFDSESPVPPDEPVELIVDLWHVAHEFAQGHRIVLRAQSSALDRFDVNPCTGGSLADETAARRCVQRVHGGVAHPSRLLLPVVDA